jgi:hypothetical protein
MPGLVTPVFIVEGDDVGIYTALQHAQNAIEPPDVEASRYTAYDARGRLLRIETDGRLTFISLAEEAPSSPKALEAKLRRYLSYRGEHLAADPNCDLPCLVGAAKGYAEAPFTLRGAFERGWRWLGRDRSTRG